ncbi:MAG: hypothetical protein ACRYG2_08120 [Janthinobacterium lividum]
MKLPALSQVLSTDPGPFATAYADVSRVAAAGDDEVTLTARAARDELVAAGCPDAVADALQEALGASTHEGGEVARVVVASARGVVFSALVRGRRPQPTTAWGALPDLGPWLADATLVLPFVLARVDHAGGNVSTYSDGAAGPLREEQEAGGDANFLHKTGADAHEGSVEEEWKRSADDVAAEIERQVTAGPSLVLVGGEPDAVSEVRAKLTHLEAEVVGLQGGRRNTDGGEAAFEEEITEALRGQAVTANLDVLAQLKQRLGERAQGASSRGASGVDEVLDALVVGQVDTLLLDPAAAAETSVTLSEHPGLVVGVVETSEALPADQVLVALAALTDADVRIERRGTLGGDPVAALLRWDNTADASSTSSEDLH